MNYERMWNALKEYLKALIRSVDIAIENMEAASYGTLTGDLLRTFKETMALENAKHTLKIIRSIMEYMGELEAFA